MLWPWGRSKHHISEARRAKQRKEGEKGKGWALVKALGFVLNVMGIS